MKQRLPAYLFFNSIFLELCSSLFTSAGIKGELDESLIENAKVYFVHVEKEKYFPKLPQFIQSDNAWFVIKGAVAWEYTYISAQTALQKQSNICVKFAADL